jgi:hypothetical protein
MMDPALDRWPRLRSLAELTLLVLPTAAVLALGGPSRVLYFNALSTHDGFQYFGVSLDPLGTTPYCGQTFRYSRVLFPAAVFAAAAVVSAALRLAGLGDWLHERFVFAGLDLPHYVLVHALVYHGVLLLVSWVSLRHLAGFLGSRRTAVLLVGVLLQPVLFRGLLAPLDLLLVTLGLRAIQRWCEAVPAWRTAAALAGLLALALLTREVFLLFVPVLLGCHVAAHGRRHLGKVGVAVLLGLLGPILWYGVVSAVRGVNLFAEVLGFIRADSTLLPFTAFPPFLLAGGVHGTILAVAVVYTIAALVRVIRGEWQQLRAHRRLSAGGLWSVGVLLIFFKASPPLLDSVGQYGRLLVLAPIVLQDFATIVTFLAARLGRAFDVGLVAAAAVFLGLLVYYQHALYPAHLAGLERESGFLESGWLSKIDGATPWLYRVSGGAAAAQQAPAVLARQPQRAEEVVDERQRRGDAQGRPVGDRRRQRQAEGVAQAVAQPLPRPQVKQGVAEARRPVVAVAERLPAHLGQQGRDRRRGPRPPHQLVRHRRCEEFVGQQQPQQQDALAADEARLVADGRPVHSRLRAEQLGHVADPAQARPAVLGRVGAQHQQQVFRGQGVYRPAAERHRPPPRPEPFQVQREVEVARGDPGVQLDHAGPVVLHERHLADGGEVGVLLAGGQRQPRAVALPREQFPGLRQVGRRQQQVEIDELTQGEVAVSLGRQGRAFERQGAHRVGGEQVEQPQQFAGEQEVAAGVVVKPAAQPVEDGRGDGLRGDAAEVPVQ